MGIRDRLRGFLAALGVVGPDRTTPGGDATVAVAYDPEEIECRVDTLHEAGLEPEEFVQRLVEEEGGGVRQQAFTDYTDWSEATVSRVLSDLEDQGRIARIEVGREKVVCLPEERARLEAAVEGDG